MQNPRSTHDEANTWSSRHITIRTRSIARSLLVPKADESDAKVDSFFGDLNNGDTNDAEYDHNTEIPKAARNDLSARWRRHTG